MKTKKVFFFIFLIFLKINIYSQNIYDYKRLIKVLSSDSLCGRGYVNDGINRSAKVIENEFKNIGIKPFFGNSYFQNFNIKVNSFPERVSLIVNRREVVPGKDYLVDPASPTIKGKYKVVTIKSVDVFDLKILVKKIKKSKNNFLCIDFRDDSIYNDSLKNILRQTEYLIENKKGMPYRGVIKLTNKKLTWNVAANTKPVPIIEIFTNQQKEIIKNIKIDIKNYYFNEYYVKNIAGIIEGTLYPDTFIIVCAHYDHLGMMGKQVYFPGANDNASGVAMMMSLANYFRLNKCSYSLIFITFAAEELGLKGADYFYNNLPIKKENIKFLINLDMVGTGEDGIAIVNATKYENIYTKLKHINNEKNILCI